MSKIKPEVAKRRIESFEKRFGEAHLYLAYHAAFPLSLTPDLLYRIWANFHRDIHGEVLGIPWIAVADLLLSSLCDEVGHELYEMNVAVRNLLLSQLKEDKKFGQQRIYELSDFLLEYVQQQLLSNDLDIRDFAQAQRWIALAYTRTQPSEAVRELALALSGAYQKDRGDLIRLASLVETLAEPLGGLEEFQPLLIYARGMGNFAGGNLEAAKNELGKALGKGNEIRVAEISLPIPKQIRAKRQQEEAERLGRQQEAERLKLQEADRRRQQEPVITRQQFLKWVGLGVAGLVTAVVAGKIFISSLESTSKTTADAPSSATEQATQPPSAQATQAAQKDALSEIRRKQLNADIRAREGRNDAFNDGSATKRAARDIESKVRSKLEANIPSGHLTIAASEDGTVTVSGTVAKKDQLAKIDTLPKQITGVTKIVNRATVAQE